MKKTGIIICLLLLSFSMSFAASKKTEKEKPVENLSYLPSSKIDFSSDFIYPLWGFYFEASPGISNINNKNLSSGLWNSKGGLGYSLNVGYFQSLSPWIKLKTGLGISGFKNTLSANGQAPQQTLTDIDNDSYTEILTLENVEKVTHPMYMSIPLIFELGNPNINKMGFYADLGIKYSFLINEDHSTSGTYSTKGTYEQWEITLENIPELGFYNEKNMQMNAALKNSNLSVVAGVGVFLPISTNVIFKGGIVTNIGLSDIGNTTLENGNSDVISDQTHSYRAKYIDNTLAVVQGSKTFHLGIEFGLYISHRLK